VSFFADSEDLYGTLGKLITDALDDELLGPLFARANTTAQWLYSSPDATITMRLADGEPAQVDFGPSDLVPEVTLAMDADTAQEFWTGGLNVGVALARGQIVATGPVEKILRLVPLATRVIPRYRRLLAAQGRLEDGALAVDATAV
jgi:hypothetical protein